MFNTDRETLNTVATFILMLSGKVNWVLTDIVCACAVALQKPFGGALPLPFVTEGTPIDYGFF